MTDFSRGREVCMLERDWWDFGFGLQDTFPQAWYYRRLDRWNRPEDLWRMPEPPDFPHHAHLLDTQVRPRDSILMVFDPDWKPEFKKLYGWYGMPQDQWCWDWPEPEGLVAVFDLGGYIYETPVPHPSAGRVTFYGEKSNKARSAGEALLQSLGQVHHQQEKPCPRPRAQHGSHRAGRKCG